MSPILENPSSLVVNDLRFRGRGPFNFVIPAGRCLGLTGPSGAGKSLLLRAIADLDVHEGEVRLGGQSSLSMPAPLWRRTVAMLPAESVWWEDTVGDHFPPGSTLDDNLLVHLGFDRTVLTWSINRLSTGEKQRLAIFRLLHNRPRALLLDEPTASLDPYNIGKVEQLLREYWQQEGIPVLLVSHEPGQLDRLADRQITMDRNGKLDIPEGVRI